MCSQQWLANRFLGSKKWRLLFTKEKNADGFHLCYTQKTFSIKDFSSQCKQIRSLAYLHTFTGEILNGKRRFLCSVNKTHIGTKTPVKSCDANTSTIFK